jgi:drug/metabolite transporter (DMT)-like permease
MDRLIGVLLVAISAACFGTNAIFARIGYDVGANVSTFLFIRFAIASLVMFLIMTARGLNFPRGRLLVSLALIGGIGLTGATLSFYTAIQLAPVNLVIIIAYMYPTMVALLAAIFLKQPITSYKIELIRQMRPLYLLLKLLLWLPWQFLFLGKPLPCIKSWEHVW